MIITCEFVSQTGIKECYDREARYTGRLGLSTSTIIQSATSTTSMCTGTDRDGDEDDDEDKINININIASPLETKFAEINDKIRNSASFKKNADKARSNTYSTRKGHAHGGVVDVEMTERGARIELEPSKHQIFRVTTTQFVLSNDDGGSGGGTESEQEKVHVMTIDTEERRSLTTTDNDLHDMACNYMEKEYGTDGSSTNRLSFCEWVPITRGDPIPASAVSVSVCAAAAAAAGTTIGKYDDGPVYGYVARFENVTHVPGKINTKNKNKSGKYMYKCWVGGKGKGSNHGHSAEILVTNMKVQWKNWNEGDNKHTGTVDVGSGCTSSKSDGNGKQLVVGMTHAGELGKLMLNFKGNKYQHIYAHHNSGQCSRGKVLILS